MEQPLERADECAVERDGSLESFSFRKLKRVTSHTCASVKAGRKFFASRATHTRFVSKPPAHNHKPRHTLQSPLAHTDTQTRTPSHRTSPLPSPTPTHKRTYTEQIACSPYENTAHRTETAYREQLFAVGLSTPPTPTHLRRQLHIPPLVSIYTQA